MAKITAEVVVVSDGSLMAVCRDGNKTIAEWPVPSMWEGEAMIVAALRNFATLAKMQPTAKTPKTKPRTGK